MKTYPYTSIKLIDGKINVFCNVEKKSNDESMFYKRHSESQNWGDYLLQQWQQNHEVFEFANPHEEGKIMRCIGGMNPQIKYGLEVTCIEIKCESCGYNISDKLKEGAIGCCPDGYFRAYFKSEDEYNQTKLAGEIISIVKNHKGSGNALFTLLTKYQITRK